MERLTIRVPEELLEEIEDMASADDVSQSEAARQLLRRGTEYSRVRDERDRLERQLSAVNSRQDDVSELVEYVEEQREAERYRDQRRRRLDEANILRRWKWKLTGIPVDDGES